ncbi:hypothetical protein [Adlercreutzia equolifaciens]|nr:hypothetical protein [Adlercreutzia equolifaciens]
MRLRTTWTGGGRITSSCMKGFGHRFKPSDIYHRLVLGKDIRL